MILFSACKSCATWIAFCYAHRDFLYPSMEVCNFFFGMLTRGSRDMSPRANVTLRSYGRIHFFLVKKNYGRAGTGEPFSFLFVRCQHLPTCFIPPKCMPSASTQIQSLVQSTKKKRNSFEGKPSPKENTSPIRSCWTSLGSHV
jgi:hypothetical protein